MSNVRRIASMIVVFLLLVSLTGTVGLVGWFLLQQPPESPQRTNLQVTNLRDNGPGSLRWAITRVRQGTITFDPNLQGILRLTSGDLFITKRLKIIGPGADKLIITNDNNNYKIHFFSNAIVTISELSFRNSKIMDGSFLEDDGILTLINSTVSGNTATAVAGGGGGIFNDGTLTLINSTVSGNTAAGDHSDVHSVPNVGGGGIFNDGTLTLINSTVSGNTVTEENGSGGGIFNNGTGTLTLINSTVFENTVFGKYGGGGGIYDTGNFSLIDSTVSNNNGGGIAINANFLKDILVNSTVSNNIDGGIEIIDGQVDILFSTIYGNTKTAGGGGILITHQENDAPTNHVAIRNSIVANNQARMHPDIEGMLTSYGFNIIQNITGTIFLDPDKGHYTDLIGLALSKILIDPRLRDNGGPTQTHALLPNSPAIDKIPLNACHIVFNVVEKPDKTSQYRVTTDQRGVRRPQGDACDIGAYEYEPSS